MDFLEEDHDHDGPTLYFYKNLKASPTELELNVLTLTGQHKASVVVGFSQGPPSDSGQKQLLISVGVDQEYEGWIDKFEFLAQVKRHLPAVTSPEALAVKLYPILEAAHKLKTSPPN